MSTQRTAAAPGSAASAGSADAAAGPVRGRAADLTETDRPPVRRGPGGGPMASLGVPAEKSITFLPSATRLLGRLRPERMMVMVVVVVAIASAALAVVGPRVLGAATDVIFDGVIGRRLDPELTRAESVAAARSAGGDSFADMLESMQGVVPGQGIDFSALGRILLLAMGLYIGASVLGWLQGYLLNGVVQRTILQLRADIEDKLNRLPLPYFDRQPRGELLSRVTNDIDNVAQTLQQTMSQLLTSLLTVLGVVSMMFVISPLLALIALTTIPLSLWVTRLVSKRSQQLFVAQWTHTGVLNGQIEEAYSGHAIVKVFGRQHEVEQSFQAKNEELYEAGFGAQFISGLILPAMTFIGNLNYVAIAVVGGLRVTSGAMSLGEVQAFIQYSRQFTQPLTQVASMANLLQSGVASAERVFQVLDAPEQRPDPVEPARVREPHGRVEFEHVTFSYDPDRRLIEDLSLVAEPGQTVAIVGPTGAGKTTLVNLVMRFYEIAAGRITLDGVDTATMRRADLRAETGMVLQDAYLFGGTIRDNIAYGRPSATEVEIRAAAEATYVDRFVRSLPDGYDTVIDDEGSNVSAGEKQLITIARAFLANPSLLILDEATSSVDTRTEVLLQHAMAALRTDRTSFVIAHRLSTIRDADVILVMEAGRIVEQGTHASLLAAGGAYAALYQAQFAGPVATEV